MVEQQAFNLFVPSSSLGGFTIMGRSTIGLGH